MKIIYWIVGVIVVLVGGFYLLNSYIYNEKQGDSSLSQSIVDVQPISHATAVLLWGENVIYTDPTGGAKAFEGKVPADIIIVTDIHGDHLSTSTLTAVIKENTSLIVPKAVKDLLPENLSSRAKVLNNGETQTYNGIKISAIPMYNLPESADSRHAKGRGNGYVLEKDGFRVYIAGDTAGIPEMRSLKDIDMAFVPMNLPFTMGVDEAASAVLEFKPKSVYPFHYRGQDGLADVGRFKDLVNAGDPDINVVLLEWYPQ